MEPILKIGIVSDSQGYDVMEDWGMSNMEKALKMLEPHRPDIMISGGDIADLLVVGSPLDFQLTNEGALLALDDLLSDEVKADISEVLMNECIYSGSENEDMTAGIKRCETIIDIVDEIPGFDESFCIVFADEFLCHIQKRGVSADYTRFHIAIVFLDKTDGVDLIKVAERQHKVVVLALNVRDLF